MHILASASPRRRELISNITSDFSVDTPKGEEFCPDSVPLFERPEFLAKQKAKEVSARHKGQTVIAADTAVFLGDTMLGKPKDEREAEQMLKSLSGNTHCVITGCCIKCDDREVSFSVKTDVTFYELSEREIKDYVATGEPLDKAGAYGVQGKGSLLVREIKGDYFNVVGLPVAELYRKLRNF